MNPILASILGLIVFILVLSIIVLLHEGGHFLIAKKSGILCHEYSIGMGPALVQRKKGETVYSIRAIPLGGYVSMAGEEANDDVLKDIKKAKFELDENGRVKTIVLVLDNPKYQDLPIYNVGEHDLIGSEKCLEDELFINCTVDGSDEVKHFIVNRDAMVNTVKKEEIQIAPYDRRFCNKPYWARFFSVFAGPLMNFVLAVVVFFIMGLCFGYADTSTTKVSETSFPASTAGLNAGSYIHQIGDYEVTNWNDLSDVMDKYSSGEYQLVNGNITLKYSLDNSKDNTTWQEITFKPTVYIVSAQFFVRSDSTGVYFDDYNNEWMSSTGLIDKGITYGDKIVSINNVSVTDVNQVIYYFNETIGTDKTVSLEVEGKGVVVLDVYSKDLLDASGYTQTQVMLGVTSGTSFNFVKCLYMPFVQTGEASTQVFKTLKLLFKKNSGVKITDLSGPVGIYNLFTQLVQGDDALYNILYWAGLISVNIGLVNLLPLPALDGGRLAFLVYEGITRKKASPKVENTIHNIGFILLMVLFVVIFVSDIIKCF